MTPTSYLELLATYKSTLTEKRKELGKRKTRLAVGLDKLRTTKKSVEEMQQELRALQPQLEKTQVEVAAMMEQITVDKASAAETKAVVEVQAAEADIKATKTKADQGRSEGRAAQRRTDPGERPAERSNHRRAEPVTDDTVTENRSASSAAGARSRHSCIRHALHRPRRLQSLRLRHLHM